MRNCSSSSISSGIAVIVACLCLVALQKAQAQPAADPDGKAAQSLPDYDRDATLNGASALDYAEDLSGGSERQIRAALRSLSRMGIDALPARRAVRSLAEGSIDADSDPALPDYVKLEALSTLAAMQAPEALDLLRQKILDPDYLEQDRSYETLLVATGQVDLETEFLQADMIALSNDAPQHASRLMIIDALDEPVQSVLHESVFNADHDRAAVRYFIGNLHRLHFLGAPEKLDYLAQHRDLAADQGRRTQEVLAAIGTDAAFDMAMQIALESGIDRQQTIAGFAAGAMPFHKVVSRMVEETQSLSSEQDIRHAISSFEAAVAQRSETNPQNSTAEDPRVLFSKALATLISEGPQDAHRIAGIRRQILFLQRHDDLPLPAALGPVFDQIAMPTSPTIHEQATRALMQTPARIARNDPDYVVDRALNILWSANTPELAEFPVALLGALMRSPDHVGLVIDRIAAGFDDHVEHWSMNPATAVTTMSGTIGNLDFSPVREKAGSIMGKALASRQLDLDYLGPHLARGGGVLAVLDSNSVDGVIAVFTPTIFAEEKPAQYRFPLESFLQPMLGRPAWLQRDPAALAQWTTFLEKVAALNDPDFSPTAKQALDALP